MAQVSYGTITITDVDNGSEAISIAVNANENAAGALSIARSTEQHFWFNPQDIGMGTQLVESGAYITDTPIDTFRRGKNGGYLLARSDGLELGRSTNKFMTLTSSALNFYRPGTPEIDASLSADGLVLAKGGIKAGTEGEIGFIYLSTDDYGTTLTINGHEASDWRQVIGPNFGVRANGIVYATGVDITGSISATGGTIGGFEIDETSIHTKNLSVTSSADNSIALSSVDFDRVINRISREGLRLAIGDKFGITGDGTLYASNAIISGVITVTGGSNVYTKEESNASYNTAGSTATRYITYISANDGIKVHNASESSSNYLQLNSTAISLYKGGTQKMKLDAENFRIGDSTNYANVNSNGLQVYKGVQVASFGDTTIIGNTNRRNYIEITEKHFYMNSNAGNFKTFVGFEDFRDDNGRAKIYEEFTFTSNITGYGYVFLSSDIDTSVSYTIKVNDVIETSESRMYARGSRIYFRDYTGFQEGDTISIDYYTTDIEAQAYAFGHRDISDGYNLLGDSPGIRSFTIGRNIASGYQSVAFGHLNKARGMYSIAAGEYSLAQGSNSISAGYSTKAYGAHSVTLGFRTTALGGYQLVCGKYNRTNSVDDFIVGCGSSEEPDNAFEVASGSTYAKEMYVSEDGVESSSGSYATWSVLIRSGVRYLRLCKTGSSERYKENISLVTDINLNPEKLYSLPVRQFQFKEGVLNKNDPYNLTRHMTIGFIAEEVEKYYPVACVKREGQIEDWDVRYIVPAMLSLIQNQHKEIEDLKFRIEKLENK